MLRVEQANASPWPVLTGVTITLLTGAVIGLLAGLLLVQLFKRYWVPEYLQNPVSVMLVVAAFTLANELRPEAGLLATTTMGLYPRTRTRCPSGTSHNSRRTWAFCCCRACSSLAARLEIDTLSSLGLRGLGFVAALILVVRPLSVFVSTAGSALSWQGAGLYRAARTARHRRRGGGVPFALELHDRASKGPSRSSPDVLRGGRHRAGLRAIRAPPDADPGPQTAGPDRHPDRRRARLGAGDRPRAEGGGYDVTLVDSNWDKVRSASWPGCP